tara:strand:- start:2866 stop:4392 length:1527 start_codon:yes stop_codon:yes gene_type:complete
MDHLLDITICHSLSFNIEENISSVLNVIPNNAFGVFVTVHRTDLPNNKDYNNNVHGCIGNWTNNINDINQNIARFDVMNKNNIIESIKTVSYKATWEDNRKNYFDTIYKDSYSDYEITFLLNNIYAINNENGLIIPLNTYYDNNSNYGVIVTDINNKRATYLPKIFKEAKDWNYIKTSLLNKAGIKSTSYQFYAYNTQVFNKQIYKIFTLRFFNIIKFNYINFINDYYVSDIPYIVTKDKKIKYDSTQDVRNLSLLNDIYEFKDFINTDTIQLLDKKIKEYKNKFIADKTDFRQASSFLVQILVKNINKNNNKHFSKQICHYLYNSIPWLEKRFERGEVLIAIALSCSKEYSNKLIENRKIIYNEMMKHTKYKIDDIFQYNWESKYLYVLFQNSIETNNNIRNHAQILASRVINILSELYKKDKVETNYYAVGFEALSSILILIDDDYIKQNILDNILYLYKMLIDRYDNEYGLFKFTDESSRVDITGHIINGILALNYNINYIINDN